jgi:hypothetical protein
VALSERKNLRKPVIRFPKMEKNRSTKVNGRKYHKPVLASAVRVRA